MELRGGRRWGRMSLAAMRPGPGFAAKEQSTVKALAAGLAAGIVAWNAAAASWPEATFILDASGSMQEAAGAQSKMEAAQAVLAQVVPAVAPEVKIGLAAYGHRRENDCADVEILVAPGTEDRAAVLARIAAMQPKGMTPISAAVTQVADQLKGRAAETTVVLVSDGQETCGGDPCATVRARRRWRHHRWTPTRKSSGRPARLPAASTSTP